MQAMLQIHVYLCFPFSCSLNPFACFSFLNSRPALILSDDFWWLESLWHFFVHPCCLVKYDTPKRPSSYRRWWLIGLKQQFTYYDIKSGGSIYSWSSEFLALHMIHNYEANKYVYFLLWNITKGPRSPEFVFSCTETALMLFIRYCFFSPNKKICHGIQQILYENKYSYVRDLNWKSRMGKICEWNEAWVNSFNLGVITGPMSLRKQQLIIPIQRH